MTCQSAHLIKLPWWFGSPPFTGENKQSLVRCIISDHDLTLSLAITTRKPNTYFKLLGVLWVTYVSHTSLLLSTPFHWLLNENLTILIIRSSGTYSLKLSSLPQLVNLNATHLTEFLWQTLLYFETFLFIDLLIPSKQ